MQENIHKSWDFLSLRTEIAWAIRDITDFLIEAIKSKQPPHRSGNKKQLLIIKPDAIGDFVIFTGILPALRELYPTQDWKITLLGGKQCKTLAEFVQTDVISNEPVFDSFISLDKLSFNQNLFYRIKFKQALHKSYYDSVIYPVFSRSRDADQLVVTSYAEQKIGIEGDCSNIPFKNKLKNNRKYTKLLQPELGWLSEIERNISVVKFLGYEKQLDGIPNWKIPASIKDEIMQLVAAYGVRYPFAVVCPGASVDYRVWQADKVASVIDHLWDKYSIRTLICGGSGDKLISTDIQKHLKVANPVCLCGLTNLIQLSALISCAKLCISMDSGPAHISVAVNTPLVCVIGGGHYKRFFPYGDPNRFRAATEELDCFYCNWYCKFDTPLCVKEISIATVIREIDTLMNQLSQEDLHFDECKT